MSIVRSRQFTAIYCRASFGTDLLQRAVYMLIQMSDYPSEDSDERTKMCEHTIEDRRTDTEYVSHPRTRPSARAGA